MKKITCVCPTFGRSEMLNEAVESFLRQNYLGEKELLIVNDLPSQKFIFDHPEVRIINLDYRFNNLGEKRTFCYQQSHGDFLLTWGDDDIHLSNRISRAVNGLKEFKMVLEGWHFCTKEVGIAYNKYSTAGAHIVCKDLAEKVNWFSNLNTGEDEDFNKKVKKIINKIESINEYPAFLYRWFGSNRPHISEFHYETNINAWEAMGDKVQSLLLNGQEPQGNIFIRPHWKEDYENNIRRIYPN